MMKYIGKGGIMNLLTDPLLRVKTTDGQENMTLPSLLAALGQSRVETLIGIQRHQEDAFHVFLCQLATIILARKDDKAPCRNEDYWRNGLRMLAGDAGDDAWTLVVKDLSRPAFMQPMACLWCTKSGVATMAAWAWPAR